MCVLLSPAVCTWVLGAQTQVLIIAWQALTELASQTLLCFEAGSNYIAQADLDLVINV